VVTEFGCNALRTLKSAVGGLIATGRCTARCDGAWQQHRRTRGCTVALHPALPSPHSEKEGPCGKYTQKLRVIRNMECRRNVGALHQGEGEGGEGAATRPIIMMSPTIGASFKEAVAMGGTSPYSLHSLPVIDQQPLQTHHPHKEETHLTVTTLRRPTTRVRTCCSTDRTAKGKWVHNSGD
jgi:hypothetical protein